MTSNKIYTDPLSDLSNKIVGETKSSFSDLNLYHDEDNKIEKIIRVKHFNLPNKGERWKILEDTKVIFVLEGTKLNKKQKKFLHSVEGVNLLIAIGKSAEGFKSLFFVQKEINKNLGK